MKRIISSVLAIITVLSCLTVFITVPVAAKSTNTVTDYTKVLESAFNQAYANGNQKVQEDPNMKLMVRLDGYELYCNQYTGEVAYRNMATGEVLTTNPVNFSRIPSAGLDYKTTNTITQLLSQVEVTFLDNKGKTQVFYSFVEAANRNQITVRYMKNGFRVEYIMGRLNTSYLMPGVVLAEDFETNILGVIEAKMEEVAEEYGEDSDAYDELYTAFRKFNAWYTKSSYDVPNVSNTLRNELAEKYETVYKPGGETIYFLKESDIQDKEKVDLENLVKAFCPDLDQDLLDEMHAKTGYVQTNEETPVFRAAIEYSLEENGKGLTVSLPASSIRFDETKYTLQDIKILRYFGAGDMVNDGYVFYPDGSGALIEFEDFYSGTVTEMCQSVELTGTVYGEDFAYYDIDPNAKHAESIRMPVFGVADTRKNVTLANGETVESADTGFLAILEEGDALADISASLGGTSHNYASAYAVFYPRPSDTYNMADAISVADNKEMTIVSDKKYTGFYKLRYIMLFDEKEQAMVESKADNAYYHASYVGMAKAYRQYLVERQYISAMTDLDDETALPLYIETLGTVESTKKVLSIPVTVDVPLTTFDNIETMYDKLKKNGITNVNFKLTGFANGGVNYYYPKKVKWMSAAGGKSGFEDLLSYAKDEGFGVYPDFNFSYVLDSGSGGISLKKHAARAVDDRYCSKQVYDFIYQEFSSSFDVCVSPSSILEYVEKFEKKYSKYEPIGISVATLGSDLNSDFNEENSLNREDAKDLMIETLDKLEKTYGSVMAEGGNIYSVQFLDHLLNASIDASNFKTESHAVPFLGMVLHGYVNYAGSAINQSGDGDYQLLKSIENGALLYYLLIYQNSQLLKEDESLNKYYSVRFDIWFDTILEQYEVLNGAIGDLQLYNIDDHRFLTAERLPTDYENSLIERSFDKTLQAYLYSRLDALYEEKLNELHIKQLTQSLMLKGMTDEDALISELSFILGYALNETQLAVVSAVSTAFDASNPVDYSSMTISFEIDTQALILAVPAVTGVEITEAQRDIIETFARANTTSEGDVKVVFDSLDGLALDKESTSSYATDGDQYQKTDYTDDSGRIVMVTYSNGTKNVHFVLNYNTYDVVVRLRADNASGEVTYPVPAYGFVRIEDSLILN